MSRLIDADALINDIDGDLLDGIAEQRAIEKIENAPTIGAWIDVKNELPEKDGDYLIFNTDGAVWIYWYDEEYKEWYDDNGYQTESVTHWMPLPEPPMGNNK